MLRLLALLTLFAPAGALACGACTDATLRKSAWWASIPVVLALAFSIDWALFQIYSRERLPGRKRPKAVPIAIFLIGLVVLAVVGAGTQLAATVLLLVLAFQLPRSFYDVRSSLNPERKFVEFARLSILVSGLAMGFATRMPVTVATDDLVELAIAGPALGSTPPAQAQNWVEEELFRRGDAVEELERQLASARAEWRDQLTRQEELLARLHHLAGGELAARAPTCKAIAEHERERAQLPGVCGASAGTTGVQTLRP